MSEKKFENRLIFGEVMDKSLVTCFLDSQSSNLLFEIITVLDGALSLPTWFSRELIDDVLSSVCV